MNDRTEQLRVTGLGTWSLLALFFLTWNGVVAAFANPFWMIHAYDGTQYHLLVRNRLNGHHEVGEQAHTVRLEGWHPIWRSGLVWIEQALAPWLGSVRRAAAVASVLGTTLLELFLLWLAWRCFGRGVWLVVLVCLLSPVAMGNFLFMAVGQGPEPWAAAAVLAGLAALVEAVRRGSWAWAVVAGTAAASAEWFRTGNQLLFAVPCVVYGLSALGKRDWYGLGLPALALGTFAVLGVAGGRAAPSQVDKTAVNLWQRVIEYQGPTAEYINPETGQKEGAWLGGLLLEPGSCEVYYDYTVSHGHGLSAFDFVRAHAETIGSIYLNGLGQVIRHGASGLRRTIGLVVFVCFVLELLLTLTRRVSVEVDVLAFGGAALAQFLGPVVLIRGDDATHYLLVALPLFVLVGARGFVHLLELAGRGLTLWRPALAEEIRLGRGFLLILVLAPLACTGMLVYGSFWGAVREGWEKTAQEQAAVDALGLEGKKVACRDMTWFVDRPVHTLLLPYATVPDLERYARVQQIDGILIAFDLQHEPQFYFRTTPYESEEAFDEAMRQSTLFGPPHVEGGWRWYPVISPASSPNE